MDADAFRYLYDYHFSKNRKMWDRFIMPLSQEQFVQGADYSHGSVRNQVVHLLNVEELWFSELQNRTNSDLLDASVEDRALIRRH